MDHVKYLWEAKLNSRNSFLMVLEFLPLKRHDFISVLSLLQHKGSIEFFTEFIEKNFQFTGQQRDLRSK